MSQNLLPSFCKSILRIEVPVVVTLAKKPMEIDSILSLVPGAIIHFEKQYDSPMTVEVDDQPIASGEIVKIGDKFGLRISEVLQPVESFIPVTGDDKSP